MPQYYTVKGGESWASIARDQLGNERAFADLMALNNAATLRPGMQIQMPGRVAENPFVSNELAAALGMATSGQVADWYAKPTNNPKFGMSTEWMRDQTQGWMNQEWAKDYAARAAGPLVNGRLPMGYRPAGTGGGGTVSKSNLTTDAGQANRLGLEYPATSGGLGISPFANTGDRPLENRRNNTAENQVLSTQRPATRRPQPGVGESEARFATRAPAPRGAPGGRRNEVGTGNVPMDWGRFFDTVISGVAGSYNKTAKDLFSKPTDTPSGYERTFGTPAPENIMGAEKLPPSAEEGAGTYGSDLTSAEQTQAAADRVNESQALLDQQNAITSLVDSEAHIHQLWEDGIDWWAIQMGMDAQRNKPWVYNSPFMTYYPTGYGNESYGSGSPGGQSYQYGLINFRQASG